MTTPPLLVKINSEDFSDGGLSVSESIAAAGRMVDAGLDTIDLSGGVLKSKNTPNGPSPSTSPQAIEFVPRGDVRSAAVTLCPLTTAL